MKTISKNAQDAIREKFKSKICINTNFKLESP